MPSTTLMSDWHFWAANALALAALLWLLRGLIPARWMPGWMPGKRKGKKATLTVSARKDTGG